MQNYYTFANFAKNKEKNNLKRNIAIAGTGAAFVGLTGAALLSRGKISGIKNTNISTIKNVASSARNNVNTNIPVKSAVKELQQEVKSVSNNIETLNTVKKAIPKRTKVSNETVKGFRRRSKSGKIVQVKGFTRKRKIDVVVDNLSDVKSLQPRQLSPEALAKYNKLKEQRRRLIGRGDKQGIKKLKKELNSILKGLPNKNRIGTSVIEDTDNVNAILRAGKGQAAANRYKQKSSQLSERLEELKKLQQEMDNIYLQEGLPSPRMQHMVNSGMTRMRAEVKKNNKLVSISPELDYSRWIVDVNENLEGLVHNPKTRKAIEELAKYGKPDEIDKLLLDAIEKTLEREAVPNYKEIAALAKDIAKEVIKNPVSAVKKGQTREAFVREILSVQGIELPPNSKILKDLFDKAIIQSGAAEIATVVGGGSIAGIEAGGALAASAGVNVALGQLAGDIVGSLIFRRGVRDLDATVKALTKLQQDETFNSAPKLMQLLKLRKKAIQEMVMDWKKREDGYTEDIVGGLVGGATGNAITNHIPIVKDIPFSGAVAVPAAASRAVQAKDDIIAGRPVIETLAEKGKEFLDDLNFPKQVKARLKSFLYRSRKRRKAINKRLRELETNKRLKELKQLPGTDANTIDVTPNE